MEENKIITEVPEIDINEQRQNRINKLSAGQNPYEITRFGKTALSGDILAKFEEMENKPVSVAGRIVSRRIMGKAGFCHILDGTGKIQIYIKLDTVGAEKFEEFKNWDIGDIIGVNGEVFKTHMGEISVKAAEILLLSKALLPLPEKFHGLTDKETRYRQRYVDLIANPEVKEVFVKRSRIISAMRSFLENKGFIEVETPMLNNIAGGAAARPFITHHNTLDIDMYLRIALELHLKRLIVGGFEKVFEIGRVFRNEGMDNKHNPEFTMMELYEAYTDLNGMMDITEEMVRFIAQEVAGGVVVEYGEYTVDLGKPWRRVTMLEAVKEVTKLDFDKLSEEKAKQELKKLGVKIDPKKSSWGYLLMEAFDQLVEKTLIQPTFITNYPIEVSPLAKKKASDQRLTERTELFITGRELANAYSELNDPLDQKQRFFEQMKLKEKGDDEAQMLDDDFVTALEYGMPPTGGLGIGVDRLVMLLTNQSSIRDILLFPTMKPIK